MFAGRRQKKQKTKHSHHLELNASVSFHPPSPVTSSAASQPPLNYGCLLEKGNIQPSKINLEAGDIKEAQTKNEKKKRREKALLRAEEEFKSQGNQWPGPVKPEMILFLGHQS